uniref:Ankyrin repeat protein n=1 Tax=viral metagenome TaxID=1070528 RepID=A0A6C0E5X9_9ZZZZ
MFILFTDKNDNAFDINKQIFIPIKCRLNDVDVKAFYVLNNNASFDYSENTSGYGDYSDLYKRLYYCRIVLWPHYEYVFKPPRYKQNIIAKNSCIFSDRYPIYSIKTIKKKIYGEKMFNYVYTSQLARLGKVDILEYLECNYSQLWVSNIIYFASKFNQINVLNWYKNLCLLKKYQYHIPHGAKDLIDDISCEGNIHILEWLKNSDMIPPLIYSERTLHDASRNGNLNVLEWWKNSGLPLQYNGTALHTASINGNLNVLTWWRNSGLELKYYNNSFATASYYGKINVLTWWKNSGLPLEYDTNTLDYPCHNTLCSIDVLNWWKNSGLELKYSKIALEYAYNNNHTHVLKWWKKSGLLLKYPDISISAYINLLI